MNNQNRKPLIGLIALTAALAMPLALAQETTDSSASAQTQTDPQTQDATDATSTDATSATGATTQSSSQATGSASAQGGKQDWASLDLDADGMISKEEASANAGLSQVFDKADANADGKLEAAEYNEFVSKNYGEPQK
ncbi:EF-hand domain-containing protein [Pseudoxanthomonas sp. UTMC 1351]|uniref:EF-hand domain-containing protein n=1 Tax=Pseudoxanthomonas sp. UTMC 1351 TaxID=2695853 RepID=UPI0034CE2713